MKTLARKPRIDGWKKDEHEPKDDGGDPQQGDREIKEIIVGQTVGDLQPNVTGGGHKDENSKIIETTFRDRRYAGKGVEGRPSKSTSSGRKRLRNSQHHEIDRRDHVRPNVGSFGMQMPNRLEGDLERQFRAMSSSQIGVVLQAIGQCFASSEGRIRHTKKPWNSYDRIWALNMLNRA